MVTGFTVVSSYGNNNPMAYTLILRLKFTPQNHQKSL